MSESAQRLSVVLEYQDDEQDWATVAVLIDERGRRKRTTLGRFPDRAAAARFLDTLYGALPRAPKESL
ncbi:MAG: hypothetical protein ACE5KF_06750 [Kiloniellaceae bacterium]